MLQWPFITWAWQQADEFELNQMFGSLLGRSYENTKVQFAMRYNDAICAQEVPETQLYVLLLKNSRR